MMRLALLLLLSSTLLLSQDESAKIRPGESGDTQAKVLGNIPTGVLDVEKLSGTISKIDLKARTISVHTKKSSPDLVLTFSQPEGREQIKMSKKAEKKLGKKRLRLDEVEMGSAVQVRYYPALAQIMELTVDAK
ncbi:MAG: hypothetical protein O3A53_00535 [Acidobacteria bacterium]|nr:hypothetical protein [Acidobacteriota bacterium]